MPAGANATAVTRIDNAVSGFKNAATAYEARKGAIPAGHFAAANASLLKIQKTVSKELTGLTPFQSTVYPHEQVLLDVQSLNTAIADLKAGPADTDGAQSALVNVDWTSNGLSLSHDVYVHLLSRLDPSYYRVAWGGEGHPVWPLLDVMPQYNAIGAGTWNAQTVTDLQTMRDAKLSDLNARLNAMSAALESVTSQIGGLN